MRRQEALRSASPIVVALIALPFLVGALHRASWASLGRDQGIFQYVAWAVGRGDKLYADVRDVNGPLVALVHFVFQVFGGTDEHRFRVLDLTCSSIAFLGAGAALPDLIGGASQRGERLRYAIATWAVLMAQYLIYGFWETAQRESFFLWFVLLAIALAARAEGRRKLFVAGALSIAPWFGKPTFALFTVVLALTLLVERRRALVPFALGAVAGSATMLGFLAIFGDVGAWARITFHDVPLMYRFIWPRPASAILGLPGYQALAVRAVVTSAVAFGLIVWRKLPVRAAAIASLPLLGLASMLIQAKGFPYHFHPVSLGVALVWIMLVAWGAANAPKLALAGAAVLGGYSAWFSWNAPYPPAPDGTLTAEERLGYFTRVDYFPIDLHRAAAYVADRTAPHERVQLYAMDAYVLFLARRASATPYIHAYDLDADAALYGSFEDETMRPNQTQKAAIRALRDANERDLLARVTKSPPAAFVFVGRSPLMSYPDAVDDFTAHCPDAAKFLHERYRETADFDGVRVWLRNDKAP